MQKYKHKENKDIEFCDWRDREKRLDAFLIWLDWRLKWYDLDHYGPNNAYRDAEGEHSPTGKKMTREQSLWFSLLFGMTYQSEMAWNIYWKFPNLDKINLKEMQEWNLDTFKNQKYSRDTKYNKGHVTNQTESILKNIESKGSLEKYFDEFVDEDEDASFTRIYDNLTENLYKYGRMTSWLACQTMFETADLPIKPKTQLATDPSYWSVRSGLMFLYGKDNLIEAKTKKKLSKDDMSFIAEKEIEIFSISKEYLNDKYKIFSQYLLESHLCQFKKLMLGGSTAHDYPGHSTLDHWGYVNKFDDTFETRFDSFKEFSKKNHHPILQGQEDRTVLGDLCAQSGQLINMHTDYEYLPNMYKEFGLQKNSLNDFTNAEIKSIIRKYSDDLYRDDRKGVLEFM